MLRGSVASSNRLLKASFPRSPPAQWLARARPEHASFGQRHQRSFADTKKPDNDSILSSDPAFVSASQPKESKIHIPPAPGTVKLPSASSISPATPSSQSTIPPERVPLTPPPPAPKVQAAPPTTTGIPAPPVPTPAISASASAAPPPPPPPPPPPKKAHRLRNFLLTFLLVSGVGYAGAIWYSLVDDNFHDFFTEYIPFGEEAVLALQERDFHRRFPNATRYSNRLTPTNPRDGGNRVTIPSKSGLSWKVSEDHTPDHELQTKGRHMNATDANKLNLVDKVIKETNPSAKPVEKPGPDPAPASAPADKSKPASLKKEEAKPAPPKDDRPPAIQATATIDPLKIDQADEPVVQDLVKLVNDIITVINADNASGKYLQPISKAKDELAKVGQRIIEMKNSEQAAAQVKIKEAQGKFDESAKELLRRIDEARMEEAASFREEFEAEREKISQSYAEKVKTELERSNAVAEQRLRNELLEQAIEMKRKFVLEVESLVEKERDGRLGKLTELQSNVVGLEKMASDWNGVIDSNLQTQQLQVAVDAVRSTLSRADIPRPFVRELAALKEIAKDDPVVNAAIASINPTAYQRGIPTSAQLVDRFRRVASEVRKASLLPEDAGIASHAASLVLSKVLFKKSGLAQGEDVESILTRTENLLEEGDLDGAAREMNTLSGWAKTLSRDWLRDVRKVLEVKQALEVIETEARLQCLRVE